MAAANRRQRVAAHADRARRYMVAVIADARRVGAAVPIGVAASVEVWRSWGDRLHAWAEGVHRSSRWTIARA
jgi:hypothetical protein